MDGRLGIIGMGWDGKDGVGEMRMDRMGYGWVIWGMMGWDGMGWDSNGSVSALYVKIEHAFL